MWEPSDPLEFDPLQPVVPTDDSCTWGCHKLAATARKPLAFMPWIQGIWARLQNRYLGIVWPAGVWFSIDRVIYKHGTDCCLDPAQPLTIFYAPGMDDRRPQINTTPGLKSPKASVKTVRKSLEKLLGENGYTVVEIRQNVFKVYPTKMAAQYGPAVIHESKYPR